MRTTPKQNNGRAGGWRDACPTFRVVRVVRGSFNYMETHPVLGLCRRLQILDPHNVERRDPNDLIIDAAAGTAGDANIDNRPRDHYEITVRYVVALAVGQADSEGHERLGIAQLSNVFGSHARQLTSLGRSFQPTRRRASLRALSLFVADLP